MRIKSVILLPVLAAAVGLFLIYQVNHPVAHFPDKGDRPFRDIPPDSVRKLVINIPIYRDYNPSDVMPEIEGDQPGKMKVKPGPDAQVLRKEMVFEQLSNGKLREREPHDQRSDQELLQPMLKQLLDMAIYERVEWNPEAMGFDQSHVIRVMLMTAGKNYRIDFGGNSPDGTMIYFKLEDSPYAYLTAVGSLRGLRLPEENYLDHDLFAVPASSIQRFTIECFDKDQQTLNLDCVKIQAEDDKGRPQTAWKLLDRPLGAVKQEDLRDLRLSLMGLRATNRQWQLQFDQLPPNLRFPIPWPNALDLHPDTQRVVLTIYHAPGADDEEGQQEMYEMVRVAVPPALYQMYTGLPPEQQDPVKRSFWVARHTTGLNPLHQALEMAKEAQDDPSVTSEGPPPEPEWISFTRTAVDSVIGLAQRINADSGA